MTTTATARLALAKDLTTAQDWADAAALDRAAPVQTTCQYLRTIAVDAHATSLWTRNDYCKRLRGPLTAHQIPGRIYGAKATSVAAILRYREQRAADAAATRALRSMLQASLAITGGIAA